MSVTTEGTMPYSVRCCRGHWHVMCAEEDIITDIGDRLTERDARDEAAWLNAKSSGRIDRALAWLSRRAAQFYGERLEGITNYEQRDHESGKAEMVVRIRVNYPPNATTREARRASRREANFYEQLGDMPDVSAMCWIVAIVDHESPVVAPSRESAAREEPTYGAQLIEALTEAVEVEAGRAEPVRRTIVSATPAGAPTGEPSDSERLDWLKRDVRDVADWIETEYRKQRLVHLPRIALHLRDLAAARPTPDTRED